MWLMDLLNKQNTQNLLKMFGRRKRNNRGMMWASLLGLGVSAAAYGFSKKQNKNMLQPLQNVMENMKSQSNVQIPNAVLAEFAKEITPDKSSITNQ